MIPGSQRLIQAYRSRIFVAGLFAFALFAFAADASRLSAQPDEAPPLDTEEQGDTAPENQDEDEIVIEAEAEDSDNYIRRRAPGVIKSNADLMDTPQSVQIVPEQVYQDQKAVTLNEAARNISNVTNQFSGNTIRDSIAVRGFQITNLLIDGLPNITPAFGYAPQELARYSRIEVLKGPSSVTFGAIEPGGAINLVTKKPLGDPRYEAELSHGRWNNNAASVDLTGPLNEDRTLLYRAIGVYRSSESFRDEVESERAYFSPTFSWLVTPDSTLSVFGHFQTDTTVNDWGVPSIRDPQTALARNAYTTLAPTVAQQAFPAKELYPREFRIDENVYSERFFGNDENNRVEQSQGSGGYAWETDFGNWVFEHRSRAESASVREGLFYNNGIQNDNRTTERAFAKRAYFIANYNTQFSLSGEFETGEITHRPHVGVDFTHAAYRANISEDIRDVGNKDLYLTDVQCSIFDNRGAPNLDFLFFEFFNKPFDLTSTQPLPIDQTLHANYGGIYGRHHVSFGDKLHLSAGLRFDQVRGRIRDEQYNTRLNLFFVPQIFPTLYTNPQERKINGDFLSPQGGFVFRPIKYVSFFASASESYNNDFLSVVGNNLDAKPIRSVGYDGGFKFEFFDSRLIATTSLFEVRKTNLVIQDPLQANRLLQSGEQTNKGFEFDVLATPVAGLNLIASYGYIDAKITKDDTRDPQTGKKSLEGKRPSLVPEHNGNVWVVYEFQSGFLKGIGIGGGVYHNSSRFATAANDLVLPEYTIGTGVVYYRLKNGKLSVTARNITNRRYYEASNFRNGLIEGRPFEAIVALNLQF